MKEIKKNVQTTGKDLLFRTACTIPFIIIFISGHRPA